MKVIREIHGCLETKDILKIAGLSVMLVCYYVLRWTG